MTKTIIALFSLLSFGAFSQAIQLESIDFEQGQTPLFDQTGMVNSWRVGTCAGNGDSQPGNTALYVSKGGAVPGCGTNGQDQYAFAAAPPSTLQRITAYTSVDGKCTHTHTITLDYKLNPTSPNVMAYVVYSTDGGGFWYKQDTLFASPTWKTTTIVLDNETDNKDFLVGFRFEYKGDAPTGDPLAIDNLVLTGIPSVASVSPNTIALCNETTAVLTADPHYAGTGSWSYVGPGSISANFTNPSASTTGLNNLGYGTFPFVWTVTSPTCGTSYDTVIVTNAAAPSNANVQDTVFACAQDVLPISTAAPISGTGSWSTTSGATIENPLSPATTLSNMPSGWSSYVWTITSAGCPSKSDTMHVFKSNGKKILTADTLVCFETNPIVHVEAMPVDSMQNFTWMFYQGGGDILTPSSTVTDVANLQMGENQLLFKVTHSLCPTQVDTLKITVAPCDDFKPEFPTVITPNGDGKNDLFTIYNLENLYPNCEMIIFNRWGNVVYESVGYKDPWDGTFKGEKLPMGAYFYKLKLNDSGNTVYNGTISIIR